LDFHDKFFQKRFLKRADGKIIKPEGWKPPNVEAEIARQLKEGSFGPADKENVKSGN
jgi:hypothetical protein